MFNPIQAAGIMTVLAVLFTFFASVRVGGLRAAAKIKAPAMTGDPKFERANRVHMNTIESMVLFLPLLWLGATTFDGMIAFYIGLSWLLGRTIYMVGYMDEPSKRAPGALITMASLVGLLVISVWGLLT